MEWLPIELAPTGGREMFVVKAFRVQPRAGAVLYDSDPYCVWPDERGGFIRWPHDFPPTHFFLLPEAPK